MRIGSKRWEELKESYVWPVANAMAALEEMAVIGERTAPQDEIQATKDETRKLCMKYAMSVMEGINGIAPPVLPSYQESLYNLTKGLRENTARILEDTARLAS